MHIFPLSLRRFLAFSTAFSVALPALPASSAAQEASGEPPARAGQIAAVHGGVSFNGPGTGGWAAAILNYPVSAGDSLYTQAGAQTEIALESSAITLAGSTELQVTQLDQAHFSATESQGETFLNISYLPPGQSFTIVMPDGSVNISQNGQYDIIAGDAGQPAEVSVYQGDANISGAGGAIEVTAGQAAVFNSGSQAARISQTSAPPLISLPRR